ncbi:MAG: hypothetical protein R3C05_05255 [Pirellulaceae bacterium]
MSSEIAEVEGVSLNLPYEANMARRQSHRIDLKNMFLSDSPTGLFPD